MTENRRADPGQQPPAFPPSGGPPQGPGAADFGLLAILGLIFGATYMFIGVGLQTIPPLTLAAGRVGIGLIVLAALALVLRERIPRDWPSWRAFIIIGMVGFAIPFALMNVSQQYIDSSLASILIMSAPLFTLVLAHFFTDDKASWRKIIGVVIGFVGVLMLIGPAALHGTGGSLFGQLLYLLVGLLFGLAQVLIRRFGAGAGAPVVRAVCTTFVTATCLVPLALVVDAPWRLSPSVNSLLGVASLGVLTSAAAHFIIFRLNARVGPNFVAANNYLAPPVGILLGALLLGEEITWLRIVAMLVIFVGIAFATTRGRPRRKPAR